ncbi:MAG: twitching motility protein PilT [Lachnospiraceae bacterium]|nr:twitching motility protein PilT [Lachnospiraceae bacterium]
MIRLIVGEKGKGKTKVLLETVNDAAKNAEGNIVFIDKDLSHMYELKNSIRLVNTSDYNIKNTDKFLGFAEGIISADHDLEKLFIDSFKKVSLANDPKGDIADALRELDEISEKCKVEITVSLAVTKEELPEDLSEKVVTAL